MELSNLSWPQVKEVLNKIDTAVLPIGAVEAHGPHLTVDTDNVIAEYLGRRFSEEIDALLLPTINYGQVWSLKNFPGSFNISDDTIINLFFDIAHSLEKHNIKILVIINGHFGNVAALKKASRIIIEKTSVIPLVFTHPGLENAVKGVIESPRAHPAYLHAEEIETSMMLYIYPEKVNMNKAVKEYPKFPEYSSSTPVTWDKITKTGVLGDATAATKEKGQKVLKRILNNMVVIYNKWKEENYEV